MRLDNSTFLYAFFIVFVIIIVAHLFIKNLLSEPIFRFEIPKFNWFGSSNNTNNSFNTINQMKHQSNYDDNDDNNDNDDNDDNSDSKRRPSQYPSHYPSPYSPRSPMYSPSYTPSSPGWMPNPESKQDLVNHIKSNLREISDVQDFQQKVKGVNFYTGYHDSDLHSEETDLSKFFNIYTPVSDTTNNLKCGKNDGTCKEPQQALLDNQTGNPVSFDEGSDGTPMFRRDIWTYSNERPMSGGDIDGILPSDSYQKGYGTYPVNKQMFDSSYHNSYPYLESTGRW